MGAASTTAATQLSARGLPEGESLSEDAITHSRAEGQHHYTADLQTQPPEQQDVVEFLEVWHPEA
jgi:hypothetical protein